MPEDLPQDIWRLILQHVPLADRLGSASLVSTTLRAAAAASPALHAVMRKPARGVAYMQYIQLFGDCLTSLHLSVNLQPQLVLEQLPCQQLLELQLNNVELRLPSAFDSCTRLTHLDMDSCSSTVPSGTSAADVLACLSVFVKLQHLDINAFCTLLDTTAQRRRTRSRRSRRKQPPAPAGVLVETGILPGSVLDSLGGQLTHLSLFEMVVEDVDCLLSSQRLCVLDLQNLEQQPALSIVPGSLPTSVCDLYLGAGLELHPAVLPLHTQLTALHLDGVKLPRRGGGGDGDAATSDGMLVLSALAELPSLSELSLIDLAGVDWPAPGPVYTALRASSTLAGLTVLNCGLPHGVWECVFRPGAPKLTGLRSLCTYTWDWDAGNEVIGSTDFSMWEVLAVRRLVGCARGLEKWSLVLQDSPAITRSFRLRSIKELDLLLWHNADGLPSQEASLVGSVAGLLSLQRLRLDFISLDPNTWQSLLPLVALTELTHFHIKTATKSLELHNKASVLVTGVCWREVGQAAGALVALGQHR